MTFLPVPDFKYKKLTLLYFETESLFRLAITCDETLRETTSERQDFKNFFTFSIEIKQPQMCQRKLKFDFESFGSIEKS